MKLKTIFAFLIFLPLTTLFGQKSSNVLLTIENKQITSEEFLAIYNKNNSVGDQVPKQSLREYLDLYTNFKLKVYEAEVQGLDTTPQFVKEYNGYISQLSEPYLVDNQFTEDLIAEAYERSKWEIHAKHIMVSIPENPSPKDTLNAWIKINEIYSQAQTDTNFSNLAVRFSEDPSVVQNGGDLGFFSAFRMVYPFETAAYTTPVGKVSKPVRTSFGYHIIYVMEKRPARGEIKASHIMVISNDKSTEEEKVNAERKINELYARVKAGEDFASLAKTYSDDRGSAKNGGDLGWFGAGRMVPEFEKYAFALENDGDFTEPFLTQFGWHIVLREGKKDLGSYEEEYENLKRKVEQDRRSQGSQKALVDKLIKEYKVKINRKGLIPFYTLVDSSYFEKQWNDSSARMLKQPLISINDKQYGKSKVVYTQGDFAEYLAVRMNKRKPMSIEMMVNQYFDGYVESQIIDYEKTVLQVKYPDYKALLTEYHDGILLFEIMDKEVWKKAISDTTGLEEFFHMNQEKYMWNDRYDAIKYTCADYNVATEVEKLVKEGKSDTAITQLLNTESQLTVQVLRGKFDREEHPEFGPVPMETGVFSVPDGNQFCVIQVIEVLPAQPKKLDEVRGLATSAYQDQLDKEWLESLHKKYTVTVNETVLESISQ